MAPSQGFPKIFTLPLPQIGYQNALNFAKAIIWIHGGTGIFKGLAVNVKKGK